MTGQQPQKLDTKPLPLFALSLSINIVAASFCGAC
jgi:hypothetical protein